MYCTSLGSSNTDVALMDHLATLVQLLLFFFSFRKNYYILARNLTVQLVVQNQVALRTGEKRIITHKDLAEAAEAEKAHTQDEVHDVMLRQFIWWFSYTFICRMPPPIGYSNQQVHLTATRVQSFTILEIFQEWLWNSMTRFWTLLWLRLWNQVALREPMEA